MKRSAALSVIIGIATVIFGVLISLGAVLAAGIVNEQIFSLEASADGNIKYTYDLSEQNISSLSIDLSDEITINITQGETDYIEFINFPTGTFSINVSTRICKINDSLDIQSILGMNKDSQFSGMRNLLYNVLFSKKDKTVNIYLSQRSQINSINVTTESNVNINELAAHSDIKINSKESDVQISNAELVSFVYINAKNIVIEDSNLKNCELVTSKGNISLIDTLSKNCKINSNSGNINASFGYTQDEISVIADCQSGVVTLNDLPCGYSLSLINPGSEQSFEIYTKKGNITIYTKETP